MKIQKSTARNTSVLGSIIAAICIIIYLAALVQASIRIYLIIDQRKITAEREFIQIADTALSAGMHGFLDDQFIQTMNDALFISGTIEALIITSAEDGYAVEKKKDHAIDYKMDPPRLKSKISFFEPYIKPLDIPEARNVKIEAVASAFDYAAFSKILKQTLLLILIGFAISFFTFLLKLLLGKSDKAKPAVNTDMSLHVQDTGENTEPDISDNNIKSKEKKSSNTPKSDIPAEPKGLYSLRSNIGWEEYTKDRLDSELHRCSSTENDLVLILTELTNLKDDDTFRQAAEEAVKFFLSRDLVFENGSYGITVIIPGVNLNTGISKAEKFHKRLSEKFNCKPHIGLSSRSGRLLNADRLILETKEALKKAKQDSKTPIIAFKSDPEKYRDFIRTRS